MSLSFSEFHFSFHISNKKPNCFQFYLYSLTNVITDGDSLQNQEMHGGLEREIEMRKRRKRSEMTTIFQNRLYSLLVISPLPHTHYMIMLGLDLFVLFCCCIGKGL